MAKLVFGMMQSLDGYIAGVALLVLHESVAEAPSEMTPGCTDIVAVGGGGVTVTVTLDVVDPLRFVAVIV